MERRGLCDTCVHGEKCVLPNKLPVWQCEEFSSDVSLPKKARFAVSSSRSKEEETPAE